MAFTAAILCNPNHAYITAPLDTCYPPHISPTSASSTYNPSRTTTTIRTTTTRTTTTTTIFAVAQISQPNPTQPPTTALTNLTTPQPHLQHPHRTPPPLPTKTAKQEMCQYTYTLFSCGHGNHIFAEDIELCPTQRLLSPYGPSPYDGLECPASVGICEGVNDWLCDECTEVWDLEAVCERDG